MSLITIEPPQDINEMDILAIANNPPIAAMPKFMSNPHRMLNKSTTLLDPKDGRPVIKNGIAENLSFKNINEETYEPKKSGEIVFGNSGRLLVSVSTKNNN